MSDAYVIKINKAAAGVAARCDEGFRFYAVDGEFRALKGRIFKSAEEARSSVNDLRKCAARVLNMKRSSGHFARNETR
jgi:hypothetical protein